VRCTWSRIIHPSLAFPVHSLFCAFHKIWQKEKRKKKKEKLAKKENLEMKISSPS
jgi:hypothetical protein